MCYNDKRDYSVLKILRNILFAFLPSRIKVFYLQRMGHSVHSSARIGFAYLDIKNITMESESFIGHGNIFTNISKIHLEHGSRINRWNRFTSNPNYNACLHLKPRASIALRHYFDVCALIEVGHDTIIGGHRSSFFTHSKGLREIDYAKPIIIGDWCYLGSNLAVPPGLTLGSHCWVGMGSVISGNHADSHYKLFVGNPAKVVKDIPKDSLYYKQDLIVHPKN